MSKLLRNQLNKKLKPVIEILEYEQRCTSFSTIVLFYLKGEKDEISTRIKIL